MVLKDKFPYIIQGKDLISVLSSCSNTLSPQRCIQVCVVCSIPPICILALYFSCMSWARQDPLLHRTFSSPSSNNKFSLFPCYLTHRLDYLYLFFLSSQFLSQYTLSKAPFAQTPWGSHWRREIANRIILN